MEFHEKLQQLRKSRGLTQEELAQALYVSRTAISKWESGRGYPGIDLLKAIAAYFSVSIDDLLSGEKMIAIAERENRSNIREICGLIFALVDVCFFLLIILPLYPDEMNGYVFSVSLFAYTQAGAQIRMVYWVLFAALIVSGIVKLGLQKVLKAGGEMQKTELRKAAGVVTGISLGLNIATVLLLSLTREAYAAFLSVVFLVIKGMVVVRGGRRFMDT